MHGTTEEAKKSNHKVFLDFFFTLFNNASSAAAQISNLSEVAGIEPRTVATLALTTRRSIYSARSHPKKFLRVIIGYVSTNPSANTAIIANLPCHSLVLNSFRCAAPM
jgi:hypothetical protein